MTIRTDIRRVLCLLGALLLCFAQVNAARAETLELWDFVIEVGEDDTATITEYRGSGTEVNVPDTLEGYPVVAIGPGAFQRKASLEAVRIPEGVVSIDTTGRKPGRGAYVCRSADCLKRAIKQRQLERQLDAALSPETAEALRAEMEALTGEGSALG